MKKKPSLILIAYTEAFIAALPFFVVRGVLLLLSEGTNISEFQSISYCFDLVFPFIILISISLQLAKCHHIPAITAISLSLSVLVVHKFIVAGSFAPESVLSADTALLILVIPLIVIKGLMLCTPKKKLYFEGSSELNNSIKYVYSAPVVFLLTSLFLAFIVKVLNFQLSHLGEKLVIQNDALFLLKLLLDHLLWFVGLHGGAISNSFLGTSVLSASIFDTLDYKLFYELFVVFGGAGAGLSLLLALYIAGRDRHTLKVARLATPLVVFNINEILIFGLPVFFNKTLLAPFMVVPLVNLLISYLFFSFFPVEFVREVGWMMPYFINGYLASGGNLMVLFLQVILLLVGVLIYLPFVQTHSKSQSFHLQTETISNKLDLNPQLDSLHEAKPGKAWLELVASNQKTEETIRLISNDNLMVYYQPRVAVVGNGCKSCEALLRIEMPDGEIKDPFFLQQLEFAGQAPIIDLWVCRQVRTDMDRWNIGARKLTISINLNADTLADDAAVSQIVSLLAGRNIDFEILEHGLADNDKARENIKLIKKQGFSITIADFGAGHSSFELLCSLPVNGLTISRKLIKRINTPSGMSTCKHIAGLCADLQLNCVAEGVETEDEYQLVSSIPEVSHIQGYYYSPALPAEKFNLSLPAFG